MEKWIFVNNITSLDKLYCLTKTIKENVITEDNHARMLMDALNENGANRTEANSHPINYALFYNMVYLDNHIYKLTSDGNSLLDNYNKILDDKKYKAEFFFMLLMKIKYPNIAVETSDIYDIHPFYIIFKLLCENRLDYGITIDEFENILSVAHKDTDYEKLVNIIEKYRNGENVELNCEKIAQVPTVVAGWCNQFNVLKREGERIVLSDDLKSMLPFLSDEKNVTILPFNYKFIEFVVKKYLFDGHSMATIENEYYNETNRRGFLVKDVLDYYQINFEQNKGMYNNKSIEFVCSLLDIQSDDRYITISNIIKGLEQNDNEYEKKFENNVDDIDRVTGGYNKIYYGVPGSGKSYQVGEVFNSDNYYVERTTFHPEYTNSDFVGQIVPMVKNNKVKYDFHPGAFTNALVYALKHKLERVCLIIEEINRGNSSAIFGDIFQLLDRDESGKSKYAIFNGPLRDYLLEKGISVSEIYIPSNMWIVATMNTSDQNVFTLDTAFKRRWKMEYIRNVFADNEKSRKLRNKIIQVNDKYPNVTWEKFVTKINKHIISDVSGINGEDKQLGMYFVSVEEINNQKEFAEKILSYLWDDVAKLNTQYWFGAISSYDELLEAYSKNYLDVFNLLFEDEIKENDDYTIRATEE